jgi:hypothetical protein
LYLVNGVLCLLVSEAIRRPYVVKVSIPLRRVTILGLLLCLPILFLHEGIDHIREEISEKVTLPAWTWIGIAAVILFLTSKLHDTAVHYLEWLFNRSIVKAGERLGDAVLKSKSYGEIEKQLVQGVHEALGLASAGIFRKQDHIFRRTAADHTWDDATQTLDPSDPLLKAAQLHRPYDVDATTAARNRLPDGLMRPILAVPVGDRLRCLGLALYGPHATGNALSHEERSMLSELADNAASAFMQINDDQLRRRIAALESDNALMQINDDQLRRRIAALESELATKAAELARNADSGGDIYIYICLEGVINRAVLNVRSGSEAQTLALIGPWTNRSVDSERCFFNRKTTRRIPEEARSCRHISV